MNNAWEIENVKIELMNFDKQDKDHSVHTEINIKTEADEDNSNFCTNEMPSCYVNFSTELIEPSIKLEFFDDKDKDVCDPLNSSDHVEVEHLPTKNEDSLGDGILKLFTCEICSISFSAKLNLNKHLKTHIYKKLYTCDICNKSMTRSTDLARHRITHTGEKPFACDICNKVFAVKSYLLRHKLTHTGVKPYSCEICSRSFLLKSNLIYHEQTHFGIKPLSCEVCGKSFVRKYNLIRHKEIHNKKKSFACFI